MRRHRQWASALLLLAVALAIGLAEAAPIAAADPVAAAEQSSDDGAWQWPAAGRITQRFGCTGAWTNGRAGSCAHFHIGIDIANRAGSPIRAARAGTVTYVGWNPNDGRDKAWIVIISHGGGLRTWYAHMLARRVPGAYRGDRVAAGDLIGYMGQTGRATGVHLHFAVERGGTFVNPRRYLSGSPPGRTRIDGALLEGRGAVNGLPRPVSMPIPRWPRPFVA